MAHYEALHKIAKALLLDRCGSAPDRFLLNRAITFTHSDRGFIVVREKGSFQEKYQIHFDRKKISAQKRRFSRTAVKKAISTKEVLFIEDVSQDPELHLQESVIEMGACSVLVAPLVSHGEVYAVIYMEKREGSPPFSSESAHFMMEFSELAAAAFQRALERENIARIRNIIDRDRRSGFNDCGMVGRHPKMIALLDMVAQVAASNATVLVRGETGSGKEKVAEAVHFNSERAGNPFVAVHCGALPETLFEAELFGHTKGAFSGAHQQRLGRIAQAAGGTLFLDEVAEIPLVSQAKLLRFLQSGEFQRLGSDQTQKIDLRIVTATHRDLKQWVEKGRFREDLYYRLNVIELTVPPLRERKSDIPLLISFFLERFRDPHKEHPKLTSRATRILERYAYPGNVRELAHLVERMCALASGPLLDVDLLPDDLNWERSGTQAGLSSKIVFHSYTNDELKSLRQAEGERASRRVEALFLDGLMARHGNNISKAAQAANMQRSYLHRLLARRAHSGTDSHE